MFPSLVPIPIALPFSPGREQRCSSWPQDGGGVLLLRPRGGGPSCSCGGTPFPESCSVLVALLLLNVSVSGGGEGYPLHSLEPDQKPWLCSPLCMMQMLRCTKPTMTTKKKTLYSSFRLSASFCPLAPPVTGDNQQSSRYPRTPSVLPPASGQDTVEMTSKINGG